MFTHKNFWPKTIIIINAQGIKVLPLTMLVNVSISFALLFSLHPVSCFTVKHLVNFKLSFFLTWKINQVMVHGGIFAIQKVFSLYGVNMYNVRSNTSLSRGKIKLQKKSISPMELLLESLSFSPGDLLKHHMPPGVCQLLWIKRLPSVYLSLAGTLMKQHMGRVMNLAILCL